MTDNRYFIAQDDSLGARGVYRTWEQARDALHDWLTTPNLGSQETDLGSSDEAAENKAEYASMLAWLKHCPTYSEFNDDERGCKLYEFVMGTVWAVTLNAPMEN